MTLAKIVEVVCLITFTDVIKTPELLTKNFPGSKINIIFLPYFLQNILKRSESFSPNFFISVSLSLGKIIIVYLISCGMFFSK